MENGTYSMEAKLLAEFGFLLHKFRIRYGYHMHSHNCYELMAIKKRIKGAAPGRSGNAVGSSCRFRT